MLKDLTCGQDLCTQRSDLWTRSVLCLAAVLSSSWWGGMAVSSSLLMSDMLTQFTHMTGHSQWSSHTVDWGVTPDWDKWEHTGEILMVITVEALISHLSLWAGQPGEADTRHYSGHCCPRSVSSLQSAELKESQDTAENWERELDYGGTKRDRTERK